MSLKLIAPNTRGNKVYYVRGRVNGQAYEFSTGTTDKTKAERFRAEFEAKIWGEQPSKHVTFYYAAQAYKDYRSLNKTDTKNVNDLIEHFTGVCLKDITQADIIEAANTLKPKASAATKNRAIVTISGAILHYAAENKWCTHLRVKKFKENKPDTPIVSKDLIGAYILAADGRLRVLLTWLAYTGKRIGESLKLEGRHIDLKSKEARLFISKSQEWRTVFMDDAVVKAFKAYWPDGLPEGRVFTWGSRQNVYRDLKKLSERAGLPLIRPHMLRHSVGSYMHDAGADVRVIQEKLGQKDLRSTMRYIKGSPRIVREMSSKALTYLSGKTVGKGVGKKRRKVQKT